MGSVEISRQALGIIALVAGVWLAIALFLSLAGARRLRSGSAVADEGRRARALLDAGPAIPVIVAPGGEIEADARLADILGLSYTPSTLQSLADSDAGLDPGDAERLREAVAGAARAGGAFSLHVGVNGSGRRFRVEGAPAPRPWKSGTTLLWLIDATESEVRRADLEGEGERLSTALDSLSALIEAAPFPMWHRGPDLRLAMVNSAYVAAVEGGDALSVVTSGIELVDEGEGGSPLSQAEAVREQSEVVARTVPATIAGERRTMRVVEVPLSDAGVAGYAIDVEDREQARAELARFVAAQRDMLDRLSAGVAHFGRDRTLIFFNQPFARLFALRSDFLADEPEFNRVLDAMREQAHLPEVRDYPAWREERGGWFIAGLAAEEEDWLLPSGKHLRVVAQPLPDGGLLLIFEDRTEQIRLASARDTLLRVRTATFDNLFEAIGVFASDGRLHLWNNRFRNLWAFEEEQLSAHPRIDALVPHIAGKLKNPGHAALVRELVRSATVERKQRSGRVSLLDGSDFEFAAVPLPDGNALFTMLDVTDSRRIEAALRERAEALEEADKLKTAFVSNMSYELRTPLTSIAGFAEMLEGGYAGKLEAPATEYVAAILDSVNRLGVLIDDVLDLTQSDSGSLMLSEDEIDLAALCEEAAEAVQEAAAAKGIDLALDIAPSAGSVIGDRRRLRQAVDHVVKNAVDYTHGGGRVLLHASGDASEAVIAVSDNGAGIAPFEQARVFDRFHRTAAARGGDGGSLGLGLPLARQFIEAHGGTIALVSEVGEGTTVTIHLPRPLL
ncbi:sensor histidine kinase [Allosphingosinicella indica]|uniref:histidine kinase n=1 Tax=Allosphingosinicella indica TaxID=941907 RepID=A0A1X7GX90_9SPHN|nr:PAS domain-containing sensor histidine kinase [Allosphingosinicella indica]SMF76156.1 PAS/PAC sensor signal transduction histidine kinase [Allosphingosinicella indica]